MPRPKGSIDPKCSEILAEVLRRTGKSQAEFARLVCTSPQTINAIMHGRANLTRNMADSICLAFPEFRFQWLVGQSDYPTDKEKLAGEVEQLERDVSTQRGLVIQLIRRCGFVIEEDAVDQNGELLTGARTMRFPAGITDEEILRRARECLPDTMVRIKNAAGQSALMENDEFDRLLFSIVDDIKARFSYRIIAENSEEGIDNG